MVGLDNPDVELDILYEINGLAGRLPEWVRSLVSFVGEYGIPVGLVVLVGIGWLLVRRRPDAPAAVAGVLWAGGAAAVARLVNIPISEFVARPRPFVDHPDLDVLVEGKHGWSFVSDHASAAMAIAVALFLVHRVLGLIAFALALTQGFARVFVAVHYPTDVVGGFALGMAVALLLAPLAMAALTPLVRLLSNTRGLGWLAVAPAPAVASVAGQPAAPAAGTGGVGGTGRPEPHPAPSGSGLAA
ncbi:phosphatase PAP2 family protein [Streptomyces millisiae]|uniref:Phosphatase PAP2 family protein n=1 Tax=Streptomyces millisiae TaxID=3075542 RepID=A0ABU2LU36_9ACTN|nr:phosphatase PAP2 family protein [Streptomyces sp. DSM 44918]MDT0321113.1 phosphatase PAP2 family protein [Streptomyces sp. DSM 44918]